MELKITYEKWEDPNGSDLSNTDNSDGYLGWGWRVNIGNIHLGWLPAFEDDKFQLAVHTVDYNQYDGMKKDWTFEECDQYIQCLLKGENI